MFSCATSTLIVTFLDKFPREISEISRHWALGIEHWPLSNN